MTQEAASPPAQAGRADGRRNRARVLAAARASFAAEGRMAPLGEIARRAGVGPGTVYRHFPSKRELFEAVIAESVEEFVAEGRELIAAGCGGGAGDAGSRGDVGGGGRAAPQGADAGAVFFGFVTRVVERASLNRALCEAFAREAPDGRAPEAMPDARREFGRILATLLDRAQAAGAVRSDVTAAEVQALLVGCAAMEQRRKGGDGSEAEDGSEGGGGGAGAGVLTAVVCDGLRAERAVTKMDNETRSGGDGHRSETQSCEMCGAPVPAARTGRPARFCGAACRQKAHRRRAREPR
ncbi:TetR/AcrR family transcriptional regulator [Streptomyces sp. NBC_01186]|uniref:helix-turn-helix domain-containing protein n=1 Tax=Streptomyces sp. NBC_01186 TaxID=2903765 RepID=UPI002E0DEF93|nr:TetR/AcrR family transcriptional regulator [Streptomyces sp. NBC_01186]